MLSSLDVQDNLLVTCSNGTAVLDLNFDLHITPTSTISTISTSLPITVTMTTSTSSDMGIYLVSSTFMPIATPTTSILQICPAKTTLTHVGYLVWPESGLGERAAASCPNGPLRGVAWRYCTASGVWSNSIEDQNCSEGSEIQQLLADINSMVVTESNSEKLSNQLASLPTGSALSLQELDTVVQLAIELSEAGATHVPVSSIHDQYAFTLFLYMYN